LIKRLKTVDTTEATKDLGSQLHLNKVEPVNLPNLSMNGKSKAVTGWEIPAIHLFEFLIFAPLIRGAKPV
jgi:hypothetical protein